MSKIPFGAFRQIFAVCCAQIVANPDTLFRFLQAGNSTCVRFAPLPIKRILALWGPLLPLANKFHTCSLISILRQVHALTQNVFDFVFCLRKKFCEAFSTVWGGGQWPPPALMNAVDSRTKIPLLPNKAKAVFLTMWITLPSCARCSGHHRHLPWCRWAFPSETFGFCRFTGKTLGNDTF